MGKYDGIYLYTDLDGTLLNSQLMVSDENRAAIDHFIQNGGHMGVATGRTPLNIECYRRQFSTNALCVLFNGGALYDFDEAKFVDTCRLDRVAAAALIRRAMAIDPEVCVQIFTSKGLYMPNPRQIPDPYAIKEGLSYETAPLSKIREEWLKIILCLPEERMDRLRERLSTAPDRELLTMVPTLRTYNEVIPSGVNKGSALVRLRRVLGGRLKKLIAIGDFNNDLEMLEEADFSAAPANAIEEARAVADVVVRDNDHSAIADLLERTVFSQAV